MTQPVQANTDDDNERSKLTRRTLLGASALSVAGAVMVGASSHDPEGKLGVGGGPHGTFVLEAPSGSVVRPPTTQRRADAVRFGTTGDPGRLRVSGERKLKLTTQ